MKALTSTAVAIALLMGVATPASAQGASPGFSREKKRHQVYRGTTQPRVYRPQTESPYYEHLADKLPIGSSRWFEQMEREGRFGNRGG
jgi:hypothetical protein